MKEHANQKVPERERFYSSALNLEASPRSEKKKTVLFWSLKEAQKMVNMITSIKESHPSLALPMSLKLSICASVLESNLLCNAITWAREEVRSPLSIKNVKIEETIS